MGLSAIGPFRIVSELGSGGMGTVYEAVSDTPVHGADEGTPVAVKVVHPHLLDKPEFVERFRREAEIGARVDHPNVVRTLGASCADVDGRPLHYLVMEFVRGQTLRSLLDELGRLPEGLCRHIGSAVATGLAAIHRAGAIHRDVKPENVLVTPEHDVKIMDLGVARMVDELMRLSQTGAFVGSLQYAAPEQFDCDAEESDHRADLYALGLLLYEMCTGRHPYADDDFRVVIRHLLNDEPRRAAVLNPQLSPFFEEFVHTLLAKNREERFADAGTALRVLEDGEDSAWWNERARALRKVTRRPLRRIRIPRETPLHGRDAELESLLERFERAKAGSGQVVLLSGEAGIGKSRLLDALHERLLAAGEDVDFLTGAYPPGGAATAAGAFSTAYREQFGDADLEASLAEHLTECPRLVPAFAAVLRGEPPPQGELPLTRESLHTVFVHATRALAAARPIVVAIDDLHYTPREGLALFADLALAVPGHRVLLIGTGRGSLDESWVSDIERLPHALRLRLDRLGAKDLVSLLIDAFGSERLAHELAGEIAFKSDGNPFFVFEIIRELREGGLITQAADGTWVRTQVIQGIRIPSSLLDLIHVRLAELDQEDRDLLDVAACVGPAFDPLLVAEVVGSGQIPAMKRLARIEQRHRLVRSVGRAFEFDHHQVREVLYGALPVLLREPYHAEISAVLERRALAGGAEPGDVSGAVAVDLCEHALAGARGERALRYLKAALRHLVDGHLEDAAANLAEKVLAEPGLIEGEERVGLLLETAERCETLGRSEDEGRLAAEAVEQAGTALSRARALTRQGWHMCRAGQLSDAADTLALALEAARATGDARREGRVLGTLGKLAFRAGRLQEAQEHHERGLALACATGDRYEEGTAMGALGNVFAARGRSDEARILFERWEVLAKAIGQRRGEAIACGNLGRLAIERGHYAEARERYERRLALAQEDGDRQGQVVALHALGVLSLREGEIGPGRALIEEARRLSHEIRVPRLESYTLAGLGVASEAAEDLEAAEHWFREALRLRREIDYRTGVAESLVDVGRIALERGSVDEARDMLEQGLTMGQETELAGVVVRAACYLATLPEGNVERAEELLAANVSRIGEQTRIEACFRLFQATAKRSHLEAAWRALEGVDARAGDDHSRTASPLHRALTAAARAHGLA